ncbi:3'-5' exonuclease [Hugenholtzia roseola]|uniref:3'-5' exonuclease n=1 Tax=Hugenholtzia roseola TaxID=1002 RepID=UPI00041CDAF2|nr:3'-5' exonuclease [Hugenholtzia roseola]
MNFVVVDLEATCWQQNPEADNEIIEIGAVLIDAHGQPKGEFQRFVRPILAPKLSDFCKKLTSIRQEEVENAPFFWEVLPAFQNWIASFGQDYVLCSWGFYDKKQFEKDCILHHQNTDWLSPHISIKHQYAKIKGLPRAIGMSKALDLEGFTLEGTHHRGIDDARNIAKIFVKYLDKFNFSE